MIQGIGVDIVAVDRMKTTSMFVEKILHPLELEIYQTFTSETRQKEFLAGRFSVKEAYMKAKGIGMGPIAFHEICVLNDKQGKPFINFKHTHVSISHEREYAIGYVIIEKTEID